MTTNGDAIARDQWLDTIGKRQKGPLAVVDEVQHRGLRRRRHRHAARPRSQPDAPELGLSAGRTALWKLHLGSQRSYETSHHDHPSASPGPIQQHFGALERDEPVAHHLLEIGHERFDLVRRVHDLDDDRQVLDSSSSLAVWMRLCAPKPMKPLITVAPARPRLRASSTIAS